MDDRVKVRCRMCRWELEVCYPFTPLDEALMEEHIRSHDCPPDDIEVFRRGTADAVIAEELERWWRVCHEE